MRKQGDFGDPVRIGSSGGAELAVRLMRSDRVQAPLALILPAMGVPARFYASFARGLHQAGLHVATADLRGQGDSSPRPRRGVNFGYRELAEDDLPAVMRTIRNLVPAAPLVLVGHSLGGQLALLGGPAGADAIVLVASGSGWWRTFGAGRGVRNLLVGQAFAALAAGLGYWPGERLGFGGTQATTVMRDWARQGRTGRYRLTGSGTDHEAALAAVRLPVLAVSVENDAFAPPASVDHLLSKIPSATISRWCYTRALADGQPIDHFRWVRHSGKACQHIANWIDDLFSAE